MEKLFWRVVIIGLGLAFIGWLRGDGAWLADFITNPMGSVPTFEIGK